MLHGEAVVQESPACGKTGPPLRPGLALTLGSQLTAEGEKAAVPSWSVPPKVCPVGQGAPGANDILQAPVGMAPRAFDVKFWAPSCEPNWPVTNVVYMILDPPRITVVPLPVISQAKPKRGDRFP